MLISCNFRYGMLVIGSESMTGEINKGDAVVFEAYEKQKIHEGNVIIFEDGDRRVVHLVVDIKLVNDHIEVSKSRTRCLFCNSENDIKFYKNYAMCETCLDDMIGKFSK